MLQSKIQLPSSNLYYRPQHSCGKVMFSHASVILFVGEGVYPSMHWGRHPPWAPPLPDDHCSARYASYWNAFSFFHIILRAFRMISQSNPKTSHNNNLKLTCKRKPITSSSLLLTAELTGLSSVLSTLTAGITPSISSSMPPNLSSNETETPYMHCRSTIDRTC